MAHGDDFVLAFYTFFNVCFLFFYLLSTTSSNQTLSSIRCFFTLKNVRFCSLFEHDWIINAIFRTLTINFATNELTYWENFLLSYLLAYFFLNNERKKFLIRYFSSLFHSLCVYICILLPLFVTDQRQSQNFLMSLRWKEKFSYFIWCFWII